MSHILNSLGLSFTLLATINLCQAESFECESGKISQVTFGKKKQTFSRYCYNADKTNIYSEDCLEHRCMAFKNPKRYLIDDLLSPVGKPGFKLCRELGAKPEIIEFSAKGKKYKLDRCLFDDGNFVDTDYLLYFYLKKEN